MNTNSELFNDNLNTVNKRTRNCLLDVKKHQYSISNAEQNQINILLSNLNRVLLKFERLHSIPWKLFFFKDEFEIENNYPHTHCDTILLPYSKFMNLTLHEKTKLLLHEKIHIYQRMFPIPYNKILIDHYKLTVLMKISDHPDFQNIRQNPDLNNIIYQTKNKRYNIQIFDKYAKKLSSSGIKRFFESPEDPDHPMMKHEHPNESFAYLITDKILRNEELPPSVHMYL
jgi:hypothetical protein